MSAPIESKVKAATGGSALGVAIAGVVIWLLDTHVFTTEPVPDAISVLVFLLIPALLTFASGWAARHTPRSDPAARQAARLHEVDDLARKHDPLH
jgi:predicted lysophospholipase L1 biosynthesis ABC-type transport system permease subunit